MVKPLVVTTLPNMEHVCQLSFELDSYLFCDTYVTYKEEEMVPRKDEGIVGQSCS